MYIDPDEDGTACVSLEHDEDCAMAEVMEVQKHVYWTEPEDGETLGECIARLGRKFDRRTA